MPSRPTTISTVSVTGPVGALDGRRAGRGPRPAGRAAGAARPGRSSPSSSRAGWLCSVMAGGEGQHALLAQADELRDAVRLDVALRGEAEVALDVDLDPQALAVEAVLVALVLAQHRVEPLVQVLVGAAPRVVDAHRVVGGDRPVEEAPSGTALVLRAEPRERAPVRPHPEQVVLLGDEVGSAGDGVEHRASRVADRGPGRACERVTSLSTLGRRATGRAAPASRPASRPFPRSDVSCRAMSSPQRAPRAQTPRTRSAFAGGVPVPDLPRARARLCRRLGARAGVRRAAAAADRARRRDLPAGRQVRPARVRRPAAGADRHLRRQHPDPDLPHRGGSGRVERRAVPERGRRLGRWPARALEAPAEPAVDRRPPRRPDRDRGRAHRRRPLRPARVDPRRLRVQRQRGRPVPGDGRLARSRRNSHRQRAPRADRHADAVGGRPARDPGQQRPGHAGGPASRLGRQGAAEHPARRGGPAPGRHLLQHRHADRRLDRPRDQGGRDVPGAARHGRRARAGQRPERLGEHLQRQDQLLVRLQPQPQRPVAGRQHARAGLQRPEGAPRRAVRDRPSATT